MSIFKKAKRESIPLKIQVAGPTGSGKTVSSLLLASGLVNGDWNKIGVGDTENSSQLYANNSQLGIGEFNIVQLNPPYEPEKIIKLIEIAEKEGIEVLIIDSITHFWSGKGGILDIHAAYGGKFQDWAKVTPRQNAMIEAIKNSRMHIIACVRKKTEFVIEEFGGKKTVRKVGLANEQRDNFEYEFTLSADVDINHLATISKDRTGLFMDRTPFKISKAHGEELLMWANNIPIKENI